MAIPSLLKQHATDVSTKWWRRSRYLDDPRTRFDELSELDQLIDAHLDGLREGGGAGAEQARSAYQTGIERRAPDVSADGFVVLALALLSDDTQIMHTAVSEGAPNQVLRMR